MGCDEEILGRVRRILSKRRGVAEKRMIGGLSFMINGKLCCGVNREGLLIRIGPEIREELLAERDVHPMNLGGRTVSSFVRVAPAAYETEAALAMWVKMGVRYALAASQRKSK